MKLSQIAAIPGILIAGVAAYYFFTAIPALPNGQISQDLVMFNGTGLMMSVGLFLWACIHTATGRFDLIG